jgi:hypothetical protein
MILLTKWKFTGIIMINGTDKGFKMQHQTVFKKRTIIYSNNQGHIAFDLKFVGFNP